jgi:hypothetical protein
MNVYFNEIEPHYFFDINERRHKGGEMMGGKCNINSFLWKQYEEMKWIWFDNLIFAIFILTLRIFVQFRNNVITYLFTNRLPLNFRDDLLHAMKI